MVWPFYMFVSIHFLFSLYQSQKLESFRLLSELLVLNLSLKILHFWRFFSSCLRLSTDLEIDLAHKQHLQLDKADIYM